MPEHLIGTDAGAFKAFLQGVEDIGIDYVTIGGCERWKTSRRRWGRISKVFEHTIRAE